MLIKLFINHIYRWCLFLWKVVIQNLSMHVFFNNMIPTTFQRWSSPLLPMSKFWLKMWKSLTSSLKLSHSCHVSCIIHASITFCLILSRIFFLFFVFLYLSNIISLSSINHHHSPLVFCWYIISVCSNIPTELGCWVFALMVLMTSYSCPLIIVVQLWLEFSIQMVFVYCTVGHSPCRPINRKVAPTHDSNVRIVCYFWITLKYTCF